MSKVRKSSTPTFISDADSHLSLLIWVILSFSDYFIARFQERYLGIDGLQDQGACSKAYSEDMEDVREQMCKDGLKTYLMVLN